MRINPITESQIVNIETLAKKNIEHYKLQIDMWNKIIPVIKDVRVNKRIVDKIAPLFPDFNVYYYSDVHKYLCFHLKGSSFYDSDIKLYLCKLGESNVDVDQANMSIETYTERVSKLEHQLEILRRNLAVLNALAEPINESMEEIHDIMFFSHDGSFTGQYKFSNNY